MDAYELDNGHVVKSGNEYQMEGENQQQGIPDGTQLTVTRISEASDGIYIHFTTSVPEDGGYLADYTGDPLIIYAFAMNHLLDDGRVTEV